MFFPAIVPSSRTYVPGGVPQAVQISLAGITTGFRRANRTIDQTLSLSFRNLTESQVDEIKTHFVDREGTFNVFYLPREIWSGYGTEPVASLGETAWRYRETPTITDGIVGRWGIDVELTSYGILQGDLVIVGGGGENGSDPANAAAVEYRYDGLTSSPAPAREAIINAGAS